MVIVNNVIDRIRFISSPLKIYNSLLRSAFESLRRFSVGRPVDSCDPPGLSVASGSPRFNVGRSEDSGLEAPLSFVEDGRRLSVGRLSLAAVPCWAAICEIKRDLTALNSE